VSTYCDRRIDKPQSGNFSHTQKNPPANLETVDAEQLSKERPQRGLRIEAVLFLDAAGRLWHPLLRDHIPLPCAVQF
jgi:hypothetical protein